MCNEKMSIINGILCMGCDQLHCSSQITIEHQIPICHSCEEKLQIHENGEVFLAETDLSKDVISLIGEYQVSPDHRPCTMCIVLERYTWRNMRKSWKMASTSVTVQR